MYALIVYGNLLKSLVIIYDRISVSESCQGGRTRLDQQQNMTGSSRVTDGKGEGPARTSNRTRPDLHE